MLNHFVTLLILEEFMVYYDLCLQGEVKDFSPLLGQLGWSEEEFDTVFLEADDWGELKRKIGEQRDSCDVLIFRGGDENLNRKAAEDERVDVILHPGKDRNDSGINHVIAKAAAENCVAIGFDLKQVLSERRTNVASNWERNLMLCEKYGTPYVASTSAAEKMELRAPRDLASLIDSMGGNGLKAVSEYPKKILQKNLAARSSGQIRPGEKVREGEK